jgi:hypothetical protein
MDQPCARKDRILHRKKKKNKKEQIFMFREIYFGLLSIESATERVVRSFTAFFGIIH